MINNTMIIAHRGESYDAPENTLAAIKLAWKRNADAVEIDVRLSKDNKIIALHDPHTQRTGSIKKYINRLTLSEIKKIDVGIWKGEKYLDEKIPTLEEIIETLPKQKKLIIEIKSNRKLLPYLQNVLSNFSIKKNQVEIISFNFATVTEAKKLFPENNVLLLNNLDYNFYTKITSFGIKELLKKVKIANLDGLNVWAGKILNKSFIEEVKNSGYIIYCWTVNNYMHAEQLISGGIDGITTDRAEWLTQKIKTSSN
ncbi:MAG: glycerophosphodiester phosphodiesterase [Ignavibacteriae bacterium]|nr:MAG: glycerophosphodiester phosphodiesterase [Ignavibacteriota bacterium]